jgi:hypothetical protein
VRRWLDVEQPEEVEAVLDKTARRRLLSWLGTDEALDVRVELRAERVEAEAAWLESDAGSAWRARIQRRLERSREWLAPPTFDAMVGRHLELNEEQRLDSNDHVVAMVAAFVAAVG